ncbi:uncharacterized protein L201_003460 [Kwoniella dendrophila CBS 6074]|uniref:Helicase C-terminal domain-containing protein n=1 Tax=Kwoniella dendrophila CBS 6074 TaxID=1295534 RepID=A0AAX4JUD6_9TREE
MTPVKTIRHILMELRKICQHPYLSQPELELYDIPEEEQHKQLIEASGKLRFLKLLLPKLKERGHRVLLFSQFKIALDRIEDFLYGENVKFLRLDGDVQQAQRQKSMDLFNAPNSDYDVFLLTTRAGGVGINLASADTVILYDPDFNPHQDLQAIARSHRYGQKHKVLVFKLMVKGSVEENIINKGKKKMVLDHLVVQQMGKESEEGDVDDLLLRGAEAVYSNDGVINAADIVYNSKNVDELIDKVEADAAEEARRLDERNKAIEEGTLDPNQNKTNQQFGFAKIWEADQNQLLNIAEEENEVDDEDRRAVNWESIIDQMEKEKQEKLQKMMNTTTKHKRKAATIANASTTANDNTIEQWYFSGSDENDVNDSPDKKKKKKYKGKRKSILKNSDSSESEYNDTLQPEHNDHTDEDEHENETSDVNIPEELRNLGVGIPGIPQPKRPKNNIRVSDPQLQHQPPPLAPYINILSIPGPSNHPLSLAFSSTPQNNLNNPISQGPLIPVAGPSTIAAGPSQIPNDYTRSNVDHQRSTNPNSTSSLDTFTNGVPQSQSLSVFPTSNNKQHRQQQQQQHHRQRNGREMPEEAVLAKSRDILKLLYYILEQFENEKNRRRWSFIILPELPYEQRLDRYKILAEEVDQNLKRLGQPKYFSLPETINTLIPFFKSNAEFFIPNDDNDDLKPPPIPSTVSVPLSQSKPNTISNPSIPAPRIRRRSQSPQKKSSEKSSTINTLQDDINRNVGDLNRQQQQTNGHDPSTSSFRSIQPTKSSEDLFDSLMNDQPPTCPFCSSTGHELKNCNNLTSTEDINTIKKAILASDEPESEKIFALKNIEKTQSWLIKAGKIPDIPSSSNSHSPVITLNNGITPTNSINLSQSTNGNSSTPRRNGSGHLRPTPNAGGSISNSKNIDEEREIIEIVDSAPPSPRLAPASTSRVPTHTEPRIQSPRLLHPQPLHPRDHLQTRSAPDLISTAEPQPKSICAFCENPSCILPIRNCVEQKGGRKALKLKIRQCEERIQAGNSSSATRNIQFALYEVYKNWPREKR